MLSCAKCESFVLTSPQKKKGSKDSIKPKSISVRHSVINLSRNESLFSLEKLLVVPSPGCLTCTAQNEACAALHTKGLCSAPLDGERFLCAHLIFNTCMLRVYLSGRKRVWDVNKVDFDFFQTQMIAHLIKLVFVFIFDEGDGIFSFYPGRHFVFLLTYRALAWEK